MESLSERANGAEQRCVAIVQARMGSHRLPGKILMPIGGEPMLTRVVGRVQRASEVHKVVVATTVEAADDAVEALCRERGFACFRGDEDDVLSRFVGAAARHEAEVIVRITADCPLIDPGVIDALIALFRRSGADYASNSHATRTFPRGLDAEVFSRAALERADALDQDPGTREHVTPFLYRSGRFRLAELTAEVDASGWRWTVDTAEDLDLVRRIYGALDTPDFTLEQALALCEQHPEWRSVNQHIVQKTVP